ncbi:MAG: TFIIB-type zinc ribbon-containing protein [Chlorobia bacterium]|nr:TFIIB-type zinc ribbon-containing protein [Fimbriimonadaceae bacterium]
MNALDQNLTSFLVECPACNRPGTVRFSREESSNGQAQFTCLSCGRIDFKGLRSKPIVTILGAPVDPYFHIPLWLQSECCGEILWAYNRRHLDYMQEYVAAKLRDTGPSGRRNLGNKLPKWMLLAKNRVEVLRTIERLAKKSL